MLYFDQAASSFPKPQEVTDAMLQVLQTNGANPGRGGHRLSREAAAIIQDTRQQLATNFGCSDPKRVLLYNNATIGLNQAIKGFNWQKGDHVIATNFEHNSIRRPLEYIRQYHGVQVTYVTYSRDDEDFIQKIQTNIHSSTRLIAATHASNVTGDVVPIDRLSSVARKNELYLLIDGSQTAGHIPIDMDGSGIDILAFSGHKGLLGPQGTGVLMMRKHIPLTAIIHGGTGVHSEDAIQSDQLPEGLESGTLNTPGIAGLGAALKAYPPPTGENVPRETMLANDLLQSLSEMDMVTLYTSMSDKLQIPILAFNIKGVDSQEAALVLDSSYDIAVRGGLHCSPLIHEQLGTIDQGMIRASIGPYNTKEEVNTFVHAIAEIASAYQEL